MPRNLSKLTEEQYEEIYSELSRASDSLESESVFGTFANRYPHVKSIKNSFHQKARWKAKAGDNSWLELYNKLQPGKINLEDKLTKYSKKQILEWIMELTHYREDQREFIKGTLEGGSNDKFFEKILADLVLAKMDKFDERWMKHREKIHLKWHKVRFRMRYATGLGMFLLGGMTVFQNLSSGATLPVVTGLILLVSLLVSFTSIVIMAHSLNIRESLKFEQILIKETEDEVINVIPTVLLKELILTDNGFEVDKDKIEEQVDFRDDGLDTFMHHYGCYVLPYEKNPYYRFLYNRVRGDLHFIDYEDDVSVGYTKLGRIFMQLKVLILGRDNWKEQWDEES